MKNILKQGSWLFFSQALTRFISFFYVIYLARTLGINDFGLYSVALAYFSIISSFADFGFNRFITREAAKDKLQSLELLWNIVALRLTLTSVLFAVFSIILYVVDPDKMRVSLILLAVIAILPQSVAFSFDAIFVAIQKLQFSAVGLLLSSLATVSVGFYLIGSGFGPTGAIVALIVGQLTYAIVLMVFLFRHQGFSLSVIKLSIIKKSIIGSLPYGILGTIGFISFKMDTVILAYLRGNFDTGIYTAAYKFFEASTFIPAALATATFPVFTKLLYADSSQIKVLYFKTLKVMLMIGLIVMLAYLFILPQIMQIFLPNYQASIGLLRILSLAIPFIFLHIPSNQVLLSSDKFLRHLIVLYVVLFSVNIVLYLIFISFFGATGAAWITVLSEIITFATFILYLNLVVFKKS